MKSSIIHGVTDDYVKLNVENYGYPADSAALPAQDWHWLVYAHLPWDNAGEVAINSVMKVSVTYYIMFTLQNLAPDVEAPE